MLDTNTPTSRQGRALLNTQREAEDGLPEGEPIRNFVQNIARELEWAYSELQKEIDRDLRLMSGVEKREEIIQENKQTIQNQADEIERLRERLSKLEAGKLMRLQRRYWRFRKKLRG